jgi:hypothetical protein
MNLRLHHPHAAAELLCCRNCFINTEASDTTGRHNAETAQYFLCLIFVNLHGLPWYVRMAICTASQQNRRWVGSVFSNALPHSALRDVAGGHAAGKTRKYS